MNCGQLNLRRDPPVVCQLTAAGRGAICALAISSTHAVAAVDEFFRAANGRQLSQQSFIQPIYGYWGDEDVIVFVRDEHYVEVHCHGGQFASRRIIGDLQKAGFEHQTVRQAAITRNTAAAALLELGHAPTRKTARILNWQVQGALDRQVAELRQLIADNRIESARRSVDELLRWQRLGNHLTDDWTVVVSGAPNVGKSSLINRILGYQRSIVYDMPGTTRDLVTARTAINGWPVEFVDTAGLRESADELEQAGVARARAAINRAELAIEVLDATQIDSPATVGKRTIRVLNKCDLQMPDTDVAGIRVSALTGQGIDELLTAIGGALVPEEPTQLTAIPFLPEHVECLNSCLQCLGEDNIAAALKSLVTLGE